MTGKSLTKLIGFLAFLLVVAGATVAAWDYESTSSSRRGEGLETIWHGVLALVGQEQNATSGMIWIGRGVALVGVALLALYVVRRVRANRPAGARQHPTPATGPQQQTSQHWAPEQASPPQQYAPGQYSPGQYSPGQHAAPQQQAEQQQVAWSTGGPRPTPPPAALSWGAVTSGPTPLPPVPQERPEQPDPDRAPQTRQPEPADMTREVIIPPLPPGWGRS
ncbi:hypothetical protein [Trujillonella humicola]|uniref:hypothetical protein n=1 Tax=Trujillonella humicola TaxID=3383699 RepID=UPI003906A09B